MLCNHISYNITPIFQNPGSTPGGGDVVGPASSINNNVVLFDGTTGKLIKDSGVGITDLLVTADIGVSVQAHNSKLDTFSALADGTVNQVLTTNGAGAYSWTTINGVPLGTANNNTLRWDGTAWVESGVLRTETTNVKITGSATGGVLTVETTAGGNLSGMAVKTSSNNDSLFILNDGSVKRALQYITPRPNSSGRQLAIIQMNNVNIARYTLTIPQLPDVSDTYNFVFPPTQGTANQVLTTDGAGNTSWTTPAGSGDVVGPASAVNNNLVAFDTTTGKLIKDSGIAFGNVLVNTDIGVSVQAYNSKLDTFSALADGTANQVLTTNGAGVYSWTTPAGSGDVVGPASAVNNNLVAFDTTTGKLIKDSGIAFGNVLVNTDIGVSVQAYNSKLDTFSALADGTANQVLTTNGAGVYSWTTPAGSGDVVGPASAVNNNLVAFDTTTGKLIKDSGIAFGNVLVNADIGVTVQNYTALLTSIGGLSVIQGDLIVGSATNTTTRLAKGTPGQILSCDASFPLWIDPPIIYTRDATLTQATTSYNIAGKNVRITVSSGTSLSLNNVFDMATVNYEGNRVEILNSTGGNYTITTTSLSNFIGGSYIIPAGGQAVFYLTRNLLTTTFDQDTHIYVGNAGAYS
jgi:hypothetical protein